MHEAVVHAPCLHGIQYGVTARISSWARGMSRQRTSETIALACTKELLNLCCCALCLRGHVFFSFLFPFEVASKWTDRIIEQQGNLTAKSANPYKRMSGGRDGNGPDSPQRIRSSINGNGESPPPHTQCKQGKFLL